MKSTRSASVPELQASSDSVTSESQRSENEGSEQIPLQERAPQPISMWWLAVPLAAAILVLLALRPGQNPASQDSPAIGKPAPRLDLVRLIDQPVGETLAHLPRGEVALLHFWGTWCGPCKMEYPELSAMAGRLQSNPQFQFVSISCEGGRGETFNGLRKKTVDYFFSEGIDGSAFADPRGITRRSTAECLERNAMFYPTSLVIGPDGQIAGVWEGYAPGAVDEMESLIERLLDDAAVRI